MNEKVKQLIEHKIADVSDIVCGGCPQLWKGECRAFLQPHSDAERKHRAVLPVCNCVVPKELRSVEKTTTA